MEDLKCGFAKADITPPVGTHLAGYGVRLGPSEAVMDPLYSKAAVFEYKGVKVVISANDLLAIPTFVTKEVRRLVKERINIPEEHVLVSSTHNHFGPLFEHMTMVEHEVIDECWINEVMIKKMADTICMAYSNMQPAMIGAGSSEVADLAFNRRARQKDGTFITVYELEGSIGHTASNFESKDVPPLDELEFGPSDPEFQVFSVYNTDKELMGSLVNFSCHAICNRDVGFKSISADFPGYLTNEVEKSTGAVCLFTTGPSAEVNPTKRDAKHTGSVLSDETSRILNKIKPGKCENVWIKRKEIKLPLKKFPDIEEARREFEKQNKLNSEKRYMARRYLYYAERYKGITHLDAEIQIIGIGDTLFIGLPGEVSVEIELAIKSKIRDKIGTKNIFVVSLCNDYVGEVMPDKAYKEGGEETQKTTRLASGSEQVIMKTIMELLS